MPEELWIAELGVDVRDTVMANMYGAYIHCHNLILLSSRLAPIQRRSTLMHELGHAYYGHTESTVKTEREASQWAARQLIPGCVFDRLSRMYDGPVSVASELGVLPRDVVNYVHWLHSVDLVKVG